MNVKMVNKVATYDFSQIPVTVFFFINVDFHKTN